MEWSLESSIVYLAAVTAMIVRLDDESKESAYAFAVTVDDQRDPPVVAPKRF